MKWLLLAAVVGSTVASDLLQSFEMKRHGEVRDFHPSAMGRVFATVLRRKLFVLAVVFMAVSFFRSFNFSPSPISVLPYPPPRPPLSLKRSWPVTF